MKGIPLHPDFWDERNERRLDLIRRKHVVGLNQREARELARLKRALAAYMQTIDPRPTDDLDAAVARIERLQARIEASRRTHAHGNAAGAPAEPEASTTSSPA